MECDCDSSSNGGSCNDKQHIFVEEICESKDNIISAYVVKLKELIEVITNVQKIQNEPLVADDIDCFLNSCPLADNFDWIKKKNKNKIITKTYDGEKPQNLNKNHVFIVQDYLLTDNITDLCDIYLSHKQYEIYSGFCDVLTIPQNDRNHNCKKINYGKINQTKQIYHEVYLVNVLELQKNISLQAGSGSGSFGHWFACVSGRPDKMSRLIESFINSLPTCVNFTFEERQFYVLWVINTNLKRNYFDKQLKYHMKCIMTIKEILGISDLAFGCMVGLSKTQYSVYKQICSGGVDVKTDNSIENKHPLSTETTE